MLVFLFHCAPRVVLEFREGISDPPVHQPLSLKWPGHAAQRACQLALALAGITLLQCHRAEYKPVQDEMFPLGFMVLPLTDRRAEEKRRERRGGASQLSHRAPWEGNLKGFISNKVELNSGCHFLVYATLNTFWDNGVCMKPL